MKSDYLSIENMQKSIELSHIRSREYGVDASIDKSPEKSKLTLSELKKRINQQSNFYTIAKEQIDNLYSLLQGNGFCLALADKDGYVLYVVGDEDLYKHFHKRNCMPGYRWREQEMGTCAIGLTLVEQKPIFLSSNSMYSYLAKIYSNAGAPIFGKDNELVGSLSLTGYTDRIHLHTLGLVCQTSETIRAKLIEHLHIRELAISNQYMHALLEAGTKGIITVDKLGNIVQTNKIACSLFSLPLNHVGKPFATLVKTNFDILKELAKKKNILLREMDTNKGSYFVSLAPVTLDNNEVVGAILSITEKKEMLELAIEIAAAEANFTFKSIMGKSSVLNSAINIAKIAAKNDAPVLILGETGTGKELFAQAIHNASNRKDKPFLALNCGAIPKELLESELFGYDEGAFTGAQKGGRAGKFELADTGTLFLDEIGDMPFDMQVKLLRVLQTGEIQRVGSTKTTKVNIRVVSATNKDLRQEANLGSFRPDLFYRISTLFLTVPPLRERKDDILLLVDFFMKRHGYNNLDEQLCSHAKELILEYSWPGNVRQLENAVERAIHLAEGKQLRTEHFGILDLEKTRPIRNELKEIRTLDEVEENAIRATITHYNGNLSQCAATLGISRPTLYRKIEKFSIDISNFDER